MVVHLLSGVTLGVFLQFARELLLLFVEFLEGGWKVEERIVGEHGVDVLFALLSGGKLRPGLLLSHLRIGCGRGGCSLTHHVWHGFDSRMIQLLLQRGRRLHG